VIAAVAEMEYTVRAEQPSTPARRKSKGLVYGPTPYGFERSGTELTATMQQKGLTETASGESGSELAPAMSEQVVLEQMRAARAEGLSYRAIAKLLNEAKVPCKRGGVKWHASTVRNILINAMELSEDQASSR